MKLSLFLIIIFCNAFLLFQIQPILAKELLPRFGGSAAIWSASMMFYQTMLLVGYLYAHYLNKLSLKRQFLIHVILLTIAGFITFADDQTELTQALPPTLALIVNLSAQIGLAFILLSSTSVLLQQWHINTSNSTTPYHWYSFSNFGSLLALISYPFLFEVNFSVSSQKQYWFLGFIFIIVLKLGLVFNLLKASKYSISYHSSKPSQHGVSKAKLCMWLCLSATSSTVLISTTQMISTNIPPMPMVWIFPLVLYLASYIFCFSKVNTYKREYWLPFLLFAIFAGLLMYFIGSLFNGLSQLFMYCTILLICCVICHGELRRSAPERGSLTQFYLVIAAGGAIGSLFSSLLAPILFDRLTEFVLALLSVVSLYVLTGNKPTRKQSLGWSIALSTFVIGFVAFEKGNNHYNIATERNFYGYLAVKDIQVNGIEERRLVDGTTVHGSQRLNDSKSFEGSYYQANSGVAIAYDYLEQQDTINLGVIGLGAGVIASYGRARDTINFYELNPAVYKMATHYFSYLKDSKAETNIEINDGRVALTRRIKNSAQKLDAIVIDAFSSDVIPAHLLTKEALELYWKNITPDGLLVIHISNSHIDLMPVIQSHSKLFNTHLVRFSTATQTSRFSSEWVVLTKDQHFVKATAAQGELIDTNLPLDSMYAWTDDHYSLLPIMKL